MVVPGTAFARPSLLLMARSAGLTTVLTVEELSARFKSVSGEATVAVFVMVWASAGVVTVIKMFGAGPATRLASVQVTTRLACAQLQPEPETSTNVTLVGSVSTTRTEVAVFGPVFVTLNVYVSVAFVVTGSALSFFVMARSASEYTLVRAEIELSDGFGSVTG